MKKEFIFVGIILLFILGLFFHKFFFFGYVPFPGDLLIHDYAPWKYESFLGYNPGSYPTKYQYFDVLRQLYPWKLFIIESLRNGQIPLWNPYNFSGAPLLANVQSQVFSPFNFLYFVMPSVYSWSIGLMLQTVLAFLFTYLYARKLELSREAAFLSSIAFSCSLYMSVFFQYGVFGQTILWLPLIFYGIEKLLEKFAIKNILLLVMVTTFAAFGGHLQVFATVLLFTILYAFVRVLSLKTNRLKTSIILFFSFCIALGISAIQFLPTIELIGLAARAPHDTKFFFDFLLLQSRELIVFISPDFYGNPATNNFLLSKSYPQTALYIGIIPLIFAIVSFLVKKDKIKWFFISASGVMIVLITNNPISGLLYSLPLPLITSSAPTNMIFVLSFSLSILAGYGFDHWIKKKTFYPLFVALSLGAVLVVAIVVSQIVDNAFSIKNALYSGAVLGGFFLTFLAAKFIKLPKVIVILFLVITIFDLFYFFQKFNPFVPASLVFPQTSIIKVLQEKSGIERVWGYGSANMPANTNIVSSLYSPEGYDPLYPKQYGEFLYMVQNGTLPESFSMNTRSNAVVDSSLGFVPKNKTALKILSTTGVHFIVDRQENGSTEQTFPSADFKGIYDQDGWKIYENNNATKRIFLTNDYQVYKSDKEFEKLFTAETFDPTTTVLLEKEPKMANGKSKMANGADEGARLLDKGGKAEIVSYEPNKIVIAVETNQPALLFLSDTYYPGWEAYVDGKETEILRANYTFRAVEVPQGQHRVQFVYQPQSFTLGMIVSFISLGILFVVGCILYVRKWGYEN